MRKLLNLCPCYLTHGINVVIKISAMRRLHGSNEQNRHATTEKACFAIREARRWFTVNVRLEELFTAS